MLGEKIRRVRKEKGLTLKDIAEKAGLSVGFISQLERDAVEPSLTSLRKVADALGVSLYSLMDQSVRTSTLVRHDQRTLVKFPKSQIFYEIVSPMAQGDFVPSSLVVQFQIGPEGHDAEEPLVHSVEETVIMLEGEVDIIVDGITYHLVRGDSILIKENTPHRTINTRDTPAIGLCILTPMVWPLV